MKRVICINDKQLPLGAEVVEGQTYTVRKSILKIVMVSGRNGNMIPMVMKYIMKLVMVTGQKVNMIPMVKKYIMKIVMVR